jgi:uncharacterized protein (TIGR03435 family)
MGRSGSIGVVHAPHRLGKVGNVVIMRDQMTRASYVGGKYSLLVVAFIGFTAPGLHSQVTVTAPVMPARASSESAGAVKPIPFEIVSIRPSVPGRAQGDFFTDDGYIRRGITARTLLDYVSKKLLGVPDWCFQERYDVVAKIAEADVPTWKNMNFKQKSLAMRPMLEDRFKLKWHMETRMEPGYELVLSKSGSKLNQATPAEIELRAQDSRPGPGMFASGRPGMGITGLVGKAARMDQLTYGLEEFLLRAPVVDKTGLTGMYDFTLNAAPVPAPTAVDSDAPVNDAPPVFPAVQQQLGLQLVAAKVPVQYVVVDHIERPTAN